MLGFLSDAAQELRDPVQMMRIALKAFAPGQPLPPEQLARSRFVLVSRELARLQRLVDAYLDATRTEWKGLDLRLERQDVGAIVRDAAAMDKKLSPNHEIKAQVPSEPVWADAHPDRLAQVIHTLLANAVQLSPRGGVIEVDVHREDGEALVDVKDCGMGLSREDLEALFEPFRQVSRGHQTGPGSSVAMSVARRIVEAHKGSIELQSRRGEGSTFRIHLPLAAGRAPAENGAHRRSDHDGQGGERRRAPPRRAPRAEARHETIRGAR
jgi:signal transduction histidine kinase